MAHDFDTIAVLQLDGSASPWALAILVGAGLLAGVINSMAGGGSFLTLPLLLALGLPATVANGTLRVGVLLQSLSSAITFARRGRLPLRFALAVALPMTLGALAGAQLAVRMDATRLRPVFGIALTLWALILIVRPERFLRASEHERGFGPVAIVLTALVGLYGGFMQAGVGFPIIALLVSFLGRDPVVANAVKATCIGIYTLVILPTFAFAGHVAWLEGLLLAAGTMTGGWLGARWQMAQGAGVIRWFIIVTVTVSGLTMVLR